MGMAKYLIIFSFILSFTLWTLGGWSSPGMDIVSCFQDPNNRLTSSSCSIAGIEANYYMIFYGILGLLAAAGALLVASSAIGASMVFPDPYKLFSALAFFLFVFATFPLSMFNSVGEEAMPLELKYFVSGLFLIAYSISFIEFMKGGSL